MALVMAGGLRLVAIGGAVGLLLSIAFAFALRGLLFGVPLVDVRTYVAVTLVVAAVALLAAWLPARRASRLDPLRALRGG
jgi:ABC-type antimicrobial peptide transport system permease subunit